jgi:hypothetical protein
MPSIERSYRIPNLSLNKRNRIQAALPGSFRGGEKGRQCLTLTSAIRHPVTVEGPLVRVSGSAMWFIYFWLQNAVGRGESLYPRAKNGLGMEVASFGVS